MNEKQDISTAVDLAYEVIAWTLFSGPGDLRMGEVREHIRALFGAEVDAALAAKLAKERGE